MQKSKNKIILSPVFLAIFAIALVFFSVNIIKLGSKYIDTKRDKKEMNNEMQKLQSRGKVIEDKIADLETEAGFERKVRERFNLGKEGEQLAIIIDSNVAENGEANVVKSGFWNSIKNFFKPTPSQAPH